MTLNKDKILKKGKKTAKIAIILTIVLALFKGIVGFLFGNLLLIADAIHSTVDIAAIFSSWFGLKISQKKYSKNFPYGYYKAENFATLIASIFIFYASYEIALKSYNKLFFPTTSKISIIVLAIPLLSSLISYIIAIYEDRVGKEINSQSLIANAQESKIDVISSLVIFGGILLSYFNIQYIESIIGIGLSLMIIKIGYQNAKIAIYSLMDANLDRKLEEDVKKEIKKIDNVKNVYDLKLRQSGIFVFGEAKIKLSSNMNITRAHDISNLIENKVKGKFPKIESLMIHIEPFKTDMIKILFPIGDNNGLNSEIVDHFGKARNFLFVVLKNKEIISFYVKKNVFVDKKIRAGLSVSKDILKENIDVVLTREIGEISFHMLRDNLVDMYLVKTKNVKRAINIFLNNKLKKLDKSTHLNDE